MPKSVQKKTKKGQNMSEFYKKNLLKFSKISFVAALLQNSKRKKKLK